MERYIGLDVHSTTTTAVVLSPSGRKTKEVVLETSGEALRELVRSVRRPSVVVMEEGNQGAGIGRREQGAGIGRRDRGAEPLAPLAAARPRP